MMALIKKLLGVGQQPEPTSTTSTTPIVEGFTRTQYLAGECDHDTYYAQFVTPSVIYVVAQAIGVERIKASTNPHFNDIPLHLWDRLKDSVRQSMNGRRFKELACPQAPKGHIFFSLSDAVCIAKRAAKQIKEGESK